MRDAREVLDEIQERRNLRMISVPDVDAMLDALRAVLDLHKRIEWPCECEPTHGDMFCSYCLNLTGDHREAVWPCDTARAITEALGGTDG